MPRIFIGSSREGIKIAKLIKKRLSKIAICQVWNEDFFQNSKSSFESLNEGATLFDFAILVATNDDIQLKREKLENIARDNVIFEFGLYIGRLGRNRCFFFKENNLDLPSDLFGITLFQFVLKPDKKNKTIQDVCDAVGKQIIALYDTYELGFVPSSVLAVGYFENFVLRVCRELMEATKRVVDGKDFEDFVLHIVIPDELPDKFEDQVIAYLGEKKLKEMKVETTTRKYNFYLDYSQKAKKILQLYDLPTTLTALKKAIEMAIPKTFIGEVEREKILKKKEMNNFCRTLDYLIKENAITRKKVELEFIDVKS